MDHGSVYRRCGCRYETTGKLLGPRCPGLSSPEHGSWYFSTDPPSAAGERRRVRYGGFVTRAAAAAALDALASPASGPEPGAVDGGVAEPVAGIAGVAARLHRPQLRGAHTRIPYPVPGRYPAGGPVGRGRAGYVHRDHPRRDRTGSDGERGDASPDPRDAARGAQRRGPRRADHRQPGPLALAAPAARPRPQVWTPCGCR
jgi:hypothetical protein